MGHQLTCNGVLEGIRICRKGFPNRIMYADFRLRYRILAPKEAYKAMKLVKRPVTDEKKNIAAAHAVMDKVNLIGDKFQYGHTKIFFRAGVLGHMEELRDDRINLLVAMMQSWIRGYFARKVYKKLWDHKRGLLCVQRTVKNYMIGKKWLWWQLWLAIKPNLKSGNLDGFKEELARRIKYAQEHLEEITKEREIAEKKNGDLNREVEEIRITLAGGSNAKQDIIDKINRIEEQKTQLTKEINMLENRITGEEEVLESLRQQMKKVDSTQDQLGKDMRESEAKLSQIQDEKLDKDNQIKQMRDELAHQEDLIAKLNREKKVIGENKLKEEEQIQTMEDKCNHLNKLKIRLEKSLDEVEDSWEREKKHKGDIEKLKRQVEGNLKLTQETVSDLERNKIELSQVVQRKEKELGSLSGKIEDEQTLGSKLNQQIKELMSRLEELDEELEAERLGRARADKARGNLRRELDELNEKLEEAGSNTAAQIALNSRREEELAKLKAELDNSNIAEMGDQIDSLNEQKAKVEKERNAVSQELEEATHVLQGDQAEKSTLEKNGKLISASINDSQIRLEELQRALHEADGAKRKLMVENCDLTHHLDEGERMAAQLSRDKTSLTTQLEDAKRLADAETRERTNLLGKMRNLEHELEVMKEHLDEEIERQLSKAFADIQLWKTRYETEGVARMEEIDRDKARLPCVFQRLRIQFP